MIGIENIKKAVSLVLTVGEDVAKGLADNGHLDLSEYIGIGIDLVGGVPGVVKNFKDIKIEFANLTVEKKNELIEFVKADFDIPQEEIEAKIEKAIDLINAVAEFIASF
jgi:hypothetical protein